MSANVRGDDFAPLMADVAVLLLGEPDDKKAREWRWGSGGSLKVDLKTGTAYDFSAEAGGGVLWLIERETGLRGVARLEWLVDHGLLRKPEGYDEGRRPNGHGTNGAGAAHASLPPRLDRGPKARSGGVRSDARAVGQKVLAATYDYVDENGDLKFQVLRFEYPGVFTKDGKVKKDFSQRTPDGHGGWLPTVRKQDHVPYRLPEILEAIANGQPVVVAEGEKAVDALWERAIPATCNAGGSGKWPEPNTQWFQGADVLVCPDNDDSGVKHCALVGRALTGVAQSVRVLNLPDLPHKGDAYEFFQTRTAADFWALAEQAPPWLPPLNFPILAWNQIGAVKPVHQPLVKGWFTRGEVAVVAGASGGGKTFVTLDIAMSVALGTPWLGHYKTAPGLVVYQAGEGAAGLIEKRIPAYRQARGLSFDDPVPFAVLGRPVNLYASDDDTDNLIADVLALALSAGQPPALVVVDTVSAASPGADENSSSDVSPLLARCQRIARETGATVLVVAHLNADGTKVRGWTGFQANVDSVVICEKLEGVLDPDGKQVRELWLKKAKDGVDDIRERFVLHSETLYHDEEGLPVTSCTVARPSGAGLQPAAAHAHGRSVKLTDQQDMILTIIEAAIVKHPLPAPPGDDFPEGVGGTDEKYAKQVFAKREGMDQGDAEKQKTANRVAWKRAMDKFQKDGLVVRSGPYLWRTRKHLRGSPWDYARAPSVPSGAESGGVGW